jgi:predicted RNase H-like HicB family nuclease
MFCSLWPTERAVGSRSELDLRGMIKIEIDENEGEGWIADVPSIPGLSVSGATRDEAILRAKIDALRTLAAQLERGEVLPNDCDPFAIVAV